MHSGIPRIAFSPAEAAQAIGKTEASIRSLIARHRLPVQRSGRLVFILADDLHAFIRGLY